MKTFIVAILVLLVLITGIILYSGYINDIEKNFITLLEEIYNETEKENWNYNDKKVEELQKEWIKKEKILAMFNDHDDLDKIELSISDLKESIKSRDKEHTFKSISETKIFLSRLKKNEALSFDNILKSHFSLNCHIML